ncbi:MAG: SseB family protein [Lachnospiraceae bacterium]|nr:SseB family protein [Lachnospiraceae bacterium]
MQFNKPVSNPMLVGSIELLKAEDTPGHRKMFEEEAMKAVYLAPVTVKPAPEPDANGMVRINPGSQVQFPMLSAPDGKRFFMAFTDWSELKKWRDEDGQQTLAMSFDDYMDMLFKKEAGGKENPAAGFVINPFGGNIAITREMAMIFISNKMARMKK